jgi:hypothetical protein
MTQHLVQYWALLAAGVIAMAVLLFVLVRLVQDSARGRLAAAIGQLRAREKAARKAARRARRAAGKLERLRARSESAKPRLIDQAEGSLQDADALRKIADDQVLVARTEAREIIAAEFPPKRQAALRRRLLREDPVKDQPFTMGA